VEALADGARQVAHIPNLSPGQTVHYAVGLRRPLFGVQALSEPFEAQAPPPRGIPFRFVAFGDSGNGSNTQFEFAQTIASARPNVIVHVGDLVYPSGERAAYLTHFFQPNASMIHSAPFMPSLGNHDVATDRGQPLLDVFVCPRNGPVGVEPERNYWFDWGDARFVALDSNLTEIGGAVTVGQLNDVVAPWVRQVLSDCDATWKFVFYHHPFYTGSQHGAEGAAYLKAAFVDVFEETGVDIVFCAF
jgi:acid phosphatase